MYDRVKYNDPTLVRNIDNIKTYMHINDRMVLQNYIAKTESKFA